VDNREILERSGFLTLRGANDWHQADVVLLFDEFHLPRHTVVALTQGLKAAKATQVPLADMADTNSKVDEIESIRVGHLLRWLKQLALRGKARQFDDTGQCGAQKLVLTGDKLLLVEYKQRLFPGATVSYRKSETATYLEKLIDVLVSEGLSDTVKAVDVAKLMGVEWRKVTKGLTRHPKFKTLIAAAGWEYVPGKGPRGSTFIRLARKPCSDTTAGHRGTLSQEPLSATTQRYGGNTSRHTGYE
jgi:hypothetical protein